MREVVFLFTAMMIAFGQSALADKEPNLWIVGGELSKSSNHNFTFAMKSCTAFLIHPKVLMTAAHCISSRNLNSGSKKIFLSNSGSNKNLKKIRYKHLLVDPRYKKKNYYDHAFFIFDYNLAELFGVKFIPEIHWSIPAEWEQWKEDKPFVKAIGYGSTGKKRYDGRKRWVTLKFSKFFIDVTNNGTPYLESWRPSFDNGKRRIATAFTLSNKNKDTCNGDSGGPVLYKAKILGLVMGGDKRCGSGKSPSAYRLVSTNLCNFKSKLKYYFGEHLIEYCEFIEE